MASYHIALLALLCALVILDGYTTAVLIKRPGKRKANPILRWAMKHGDLWLIGKLALSIIAIWFLRGEPLWLAALAGVYALVVYNNARHM